MHTENTTDNNDNTDEGGGSRPLGFWLRTVDALISREFAKTFDDEGITRREWMLLNAVAGEVKVPGFAERVARKGKRLRGLEERGWVEEAGDGTWTLTDEGRAAKARLGTLVDDIRSRVAGAVSPEDYATMLASLEAIARELGWDEHDRMPWIGFGRGLGGGFGRGFGPRPFGGDIHRGFGPNLYHGFGPGFGPGGGPAGMPGGTENFAQHHDRHDHGDCHGHGHGRGHGHGHRHGGQDAESAYERGFDAGFRRGQSQAS